MGHGFEEEWYKIGYQDAVKKACNWLEKNIVKETSVLPYGSAYIDFNNLIMKFKKAMEK